MPSRDHETGTVTTVREFIKDTKITEPISTEIGLDASLLTCDKSKLYPLVDYE